MSFFKNTQAFKSKPVRSKKPRNPNPNPHKAEIMGLNQRIAELEGLLEQREASIADLDARLKLHSKVKEPAKTKKAAKKKTAKKEQEEE